MEELTAYRARVEAWMGEHMPARSPDAPWDPMDDDHRGSRNRDLQARLASGGFAGVCYPRDYGGQGLTIEHKRIVDEVSDGYDMPILFSVPTMSITGPTILEFGTEAQKQRYVPAWIRGDELWVQFMSEPSGGSDMAGVLTRADRDGDSFVLNGSKIWSTYAYRADYALCLARTNWDVPKHSGLTMFIVPVHHPGIEITQIRMVDGNEEFCQEFFDDVVIPAENVLGEVDDGWTVASRLLFHERAAVGGASPYTCGRHRGGGDAWSRDRLLDLARRAGRLDDLRARQLLGQSEVLDAVQHLLIDRVRMGIETGALPGPAGSIARLFGGMAAVERATIGLELQGDGALVWPTGDGGSGVGVEFVQRQSSCLGGGSTEMARNLISERLLGMPREPAADRDRPFREVQRGSAALPTADAGAAR